MWYSYTYFIFVLTGTNMGTYWTYNVASAYILLAIVFRKQFRNKLPVDCIYINFTKGVSHILERHTSNSYFYSIVVDRKQLSFSPLLLSTGRNIHSLLWCFPTNNIIIIIVLAYMLVQFIDKPIYLQCDKNLVVLELRTTRKKFPASHWHQGSRNLQFKAFIKMHFNGIFFLSRFKSHVVTGWLTWNSL